MSDLDNTKDKPPVELTSSGGKILEFPDNRLRVEDAVQAGLTSTETLVMLTTGQIQPPDGDIPLDFNDPTKRIEGELTTIRALEQRALKKLGTSSGKVKDRINTLSSVAGAIIMGELTGSLGRVQDEHRDEVLAITMTLLADFSEDAEAILGIAFCFGHEAVLDALAMSDEELGENLSSTTTDPENPEFNLSRLILKARENINKKSTTEERLKKGKQALKTMRLVR